MGDDDAFVQGKYAELGRAVARMALPLIEEFRQRDGYATNELAKAEVLELKIANRALKIELINAKQRISELERRR